MTGGAVGAAGARRAARPKAPRRPARGRGQKRYEALIDATEFLLRSEDPDEVGLYRIAEQADVPPASVYHFFPTREAAFTAVAIRVTERLLEVHRAPVRARQILSWQALFELDVGRAREFFTSNPAGMKILYGGYGGIDSGNVDRAVSTRIAISAYDRLNRLFHMPFMREASRMFEVRLAILDSLWSLSVRRHGSITQQYFDESLQACLSYSRTFLPERLELRDVLREAAAGDGLVVAGFEVEGEAPA